VATLYDHLGRPVDLGALKREHAEATVTGVRSPFRESVASTLNPRRLARLLRAADEGDTESFLILAEEMEERELHYRSVLGTRKLAVSGAPVQVDAAGDDARSKEIADAVRMDLIEGDAFADLLFDVLDGLGKGFSVNEIIWDTEGKRWKPAAYKWRDPRFFIWDQQTLQVLSLRDEADPSFGVPLAPFKFVVHVPKLKSGIPLRGGLARVAAAAYMLKSFTVRDWHTFMEVFGMPLRVGKFGPDATDDEKEALRRAVADIAIDAAGIIPQSMQIEFIEAMRAAGGEKLFQGAAEWWDKQVSKVVLGQTMTSEDGSSLAQAKVHNDVRLDLAQSDARQLSVAINRHLVKPYVDLNFGVQERYPAITVKVDEPEDAEKNARTIGVLVENGARIPEWWVREKFGYPEPQGDEPLMGAKPAPEPTGEPPVPPAPDLNARLARLEVALNRRARTRDELDRLTDAALEDWEPMLDGTVGRVMALARASTSFEDFEQRIAQAAEDLEIDELTRRLAVELFKARGLGDATDRVQ
jgi:phage gp29-like protein